MEITEIASGFEFPEGPVWMPDGTVLCVELKRRTVDRVHPDGRIETIATPGGSPNGLAIGPDGAGYVCNSGGWDFVDVMGMTVTSTVQPADYSGGRIERVDLDTGEVRVLYTECDGHPLMGPNDLVFDADGGMWFTDHGKIRARDRDEGGVYYAAPDGSSIREVIGPLAHHGALLAGLPGMQLLDSLGVDGGGYVVVGTLINGGLTVIAPDADGDGITGVEHIPIPDILVTNVCFGGENLQTAFATCSGTGKLVSMPWPRPGLELNF